MNDTPAVTTTHIPLAAIDPPERDSRTRHEIDSMVEWFKAFGQIQPIVVVELTGGRYRIVAGNRRFRAAQALNWKYIRAEILERDEAAIAQDEFIRAAENLGRLDLNPIEEAQQVLQLLEAHRQDVPAAAVSEEQAEAVEEARLAAIAETLGKSPKWVRERLYIARLGKKARELVLAGRLPLAHAALLARVADPGRRDSLAQACAADGDGGNLWPLATLRHHVERQRFSLRTVPWQLDVPFAGKPACDACPSNTACDVHLFPDHTDTEPRCTNRGCFDAKVRAAEKAIERVTTRIEAAVKQGQQPPTTPAAMAEAKLVPKAIKPASIARRAKALVEKQPSKKRSVSTGSAAAKRSTSLAGQAAEQYYRAAAQARSDVRTAVYGWVQSDPARLLTFALLITTKDGWPQFAVDQGWHAPEHSAAKLSRSKQVRDLAALLDQATTETVLARAAKAKLDNFYWVDPEETELRAIALAVGLANCPPLLDRDPWIEQYVADHTATEKAAPPAPKKKRRTKAPVTKTKGAS